MQNEKIQNRTLVIILVKSFVLILTFDAPLLPI